MTNVDKELHNPEVTFANLIRERTTSKAKRALRGAAGGIYIGPVLSMASGAKESSISHATGAAAGGADTSTGYRASNTYFADGDATGGGTGGATGTARVTGRTMYRGDGTFGGSVVGYPAQRAGQRAAAATGDSLSASGSAAAFIDKRSSIFGDGGHALGSAGRGTRVLGTTVTGSGVGQASGQPRIVRPTIQEGANPAAGVVSVGDGTGLVTCDLHADDITDGARGLAGCVVYIFARDADTDEDLALVAKGDHDSTTEGTLTGSSGLAAATYSCYAAFKDTAGNIGPWSARSTVVVS